MGLPEQNRNMTNHERSFQIPFNPASRDFAGYPMPASVPDGMRLELSRSRIIPGQEDVFDEWMDMLNSRPTELQEGLSAERQVFEASRQMVRRGFIISPSWASTAVRMMNRSRWTLIMLPTVDVPKNQVGKNLSRGSCWPPASSST